MSEEEIEGRLRQMEVELQLFIGNNLTGQSIRTFKETLKYDILPAEMERCNDFNDLWNQLYMKNRLRLGDYDFLKQRFDILDLNAISERIEVIQGFMKQMKPWPSGTVHDSIVDGPTFYEQLKDLEKLKRVSPNTTLDQINHPNAVAAIVSQDRERALHLKDRFSLLIPKEAVGDWLVVYCHFDFSNGIVMEDSLLRVEQPEQNIVWCGIPVTCGPTPHQFRSPVNIALGHSIALTEQFNIKNLEIYLKRVNGNFEPIGSKTCIFERSGFVIIETDHFSTYCLGVDATKPQVLPNLKLAVLASIRESAQSGLYIDLMVMLDSECMVQMACENALATKMEASFRKSNCASFIAKPNNDLVLVVTDASQGKINSVTLPKQVLKNVAFKPVLVSKPIVQTENSQVCTVVIKQEEPILIFNILPKTYEMKEVRSLLPSPSKVDRNTNLAPTLEFHAANPGKRQGIEGKTAAVEMNQEHDRGMEIDDAEHSDPGTASDNISACSIDHDALPKDAMRSSVAILAEPLVKENRSFKENLDGEKDLRFKVVYEGLEAKLREFYRREKEELKKEYREDIANMKTGFEKQISALEKDVEFWKDAANKAEGIEREKFKAQLQDLSIQLETRSLNAQEDEERMRKAEAECADKVAKLEAQLHEQRTEAEKMLKKVTEATGQADEVQRIEGLVQDHEAIVSMSNIQSNEPAVSNAVDKRLSRIESLLEEKFKMAEELQQRLEVEKARYLSDKQRLIYEGENKLKKLQNYHEEQLNEVESRHRETVQMDEHRQHMMEKKELQAHSEMSKYAERIKEMTKENARAFFLPRREKQPNTVLPPQGKLQ